MICFTLAFVSIHDNLHRYNVVAFKSNLNSSFSCFEHPCVMRHWFTFSHHDLDLCIFYFLFYFFLFDYNECVLCMWRVCHYLPYFVLLLGLFTMRICCSHTFPYLCFLDWVCFNRFIISYPHSTKSTPIPLTCNNFIALFLIAFYLGSF